MIGGVNVQRLVFPAAIVASLCGGGLWLGWTAQTILSGIREDVTKQMGAIQTEVKSQVSAVADQVEAIADTVDDRAAEANFQLEKINEHLSRMDSNVVTEIQMKLYVKEAQAVGIALPDWSND